MRFFHFTIFWKIQNSELGGYFPWREIKPARDALSKPGEMSASKAGADALTLRRFCGNSGAVKYALTGAPLAAIFTAGAPVTAFKKIIGAGGGTDTALCRPRRIYQRAFKCFGAGA